MKRILGIIAILVATLALAQQPYFETFEVRLHNLDVVVTDAKGSPVRGLTKDDFIVLENGAPQTITNFSAYDSTVTHAASNKASASATASAPAKEERQPPRRVVFFVDDMEVQTPTRKRLVKTASSFLDQLQEGDLAAVIRPTGVERVAQSYTTDLKAVRSKLVEAIESCKVRGDSEGAGEIRAMRRRLENAIHVMEEKHAKAEYATRARERSQQRLAQIRALVGSLAGVEGRKILVLIVYGIPSQPGTDAFTQMELIGGEAVDRMATDWSKLVDLTPEIDELGRTAAANGVTIYAMEPELPYGLFEQRTAGSRPSGSTYTPGGHASVAQGVGMENMYARMNLQAQTLDSLTEKTGGKWFRGTETMDDLFRQVATDLSAYYSLAYRATGKHDKPRKVEVRVRNRPELRVRTRSEVIDKSPEREMADLTVSNLLFPREINELRIAVTKGELTQQGRNVTVPLDIVVPLETLTFVERDGGKYVATIDIHYAAAGHENNYTTTGRHQQHIEITAEQYQARTGITYRFKTGVQLPAGPSKIAIGVFDAASRLAGFATVDVTS